MTEKGKSERKKLAVTEVKEPQELNRKEGQGTFQKLVFFAKDGETGPLDYQVFSSALFPAVKEALNGTLECDVSVSERVWDGNPYTDRKVTQVYINGQPVKKQGAYRQGYNAYSPERIASEEAQKAAELIVQLRIGGPLTDDSPLYKKALTWLDEKLSARPSEAAKPAGTPPPQKAPANAGFYGQFWQAAKTLGIEKEECHTVLGVKSLKDWAGSMAEAIDIITKWATLVKFAKGINIERARVLTILKHPSMVDYLGNNFTWKDAAETLKRVAEGRKKAAVAEADPEGIFR